MRRAKHGRKRVGWIALLAALVMVPMAGAADLGPNPGRDLPNLVPTLLLG
jgi:hypothetical protein